MLTLENAGYGIGIVDVDTMELLHAVLYASPPGEVEIRELKDELMEDPQLFEVVKDKNFALLELSPDAIDLIKEKWGETAVFHDGSERQE